MKLGVFGGSFDPPHVGHVAIAAMTLAVVDIDELLVVPCFSHALGKELTDFEHRYRMSELAFADLYRTAVSDIEDRLGGTSFTLRTVERLTMEHPGARLSLVAGADAVRDKDAWYRFDQVERLAELVVFKRAGIELPFGDGQGEYPLGGRKLLPAPPDVSSTAIRALMKRGRTVRGLVPEPVLRYIGQHELYQ